MIKADNQNHNNGQFLIDEELEQYNSWSKFQIYSAYMVEEATRKKLQTENNELRRRLAELRYIIK